MKRFIVLVGLPGSGKSTYAKKIYGDDPGAVILSADELRKEFGYEPGTGHMFIFPEMIKRAKKALSEGKDVVYDATNLSRKHRISLLEEMRKYCHRRECVLFAEPFNVCCSRNGQREAKAVVPMDDFLHLLKSFNVPMSCEGFDSIEVIQTGKPVDISDLFEKTKGFEQDNSHHSLDLDQHLIRTENNAVKLGGSDLVVEAARYHDIGKLYTKSFINSRGEETHEAHFYQHENVGAYMYLVCSVNCHGNVHGISDVLYISSLINWHMRPYLEMNSEKREREYRMLGAGFVDDLMLLHQADALAH